MPGPDTSAALEELELALMDAVRKRDMETLEGLVGADFTLTTGRPGAEVRTRAEWMRITETSYELAEFEFEEMAVTVYDGCAIVRSRYSQRASMDGRPRNTTFRMTDVWVGGPGTWKLQARHAQPVAGD